MSIARKRIILKCSFFYKFEEHKVGYFSTKPQPEKLKINWDINLFNKIGRTVYHFRKLREGGGGVYILSITTIFHIKNFFYCILLKKHHFFWFQNFECSFFEIFKHHIVIKKYVSIIFEHRTRQIKKLRGIIFTWNNPYAYIVIGTYSNAYAFSKYNSHDFIHKQYGNSLWIVYINSEPHEKVPDVICSYN